MRKISALLASFAVAAFFTVYPVFAATVVREYDNVNILGNFYDIDLGYYYSTTDIVPAFSWAEAAEPLTQINMRLQMDGLTTVGGGSWYLLPLSDYWSGAVGYYCAASSYTGGTWQIVYSGAYPAIFAWGPYSGTNATADIVLHGSEVPLPGALWLLGSGLIGIVGIRRKIKN